MAVGSRLDFEDEFTDYDPSPLKSKKSASFQNEFTDFEPQSEEKGFMERMLESLGKGAAIQAQVSAGGGVEGLKQVGEFGKGALSGATLGLSEKFESLTPEEGNVLAGLGEIYGSILPIEAIYGAIGRPLVSLASKSPVARMGLESLARMTGFGATGATMKAGREFIDKGELPSPEELAKEGATWMVIDAAVQSVGLGVEFGSAVRNIAKAEGITSKEVLSRLWNSTKNYVRQKFGRTLTPETIEPQDVEVLIEETKLLEDRSMTKEPVEVEVKGKLKSREPIKAEEFVDIEEPVEEVASLKEFPKERITAHKELPLEENSVEIPEGAVLKKPEDIKIGERAGKGSATVSVERDGAFFPEQITITPEEKQLIDASNQWGKAGDQAESSKLAQEAREMIYERLSPIHEERLSEEKLGEELLSKGPSIAQQMAHRRPIMGKKQAVARSKILDHFRTAFKDPIRLGKISNKRALGIHKLWPRVSRLLHDNDIETAAHEIGHNLHTVLYGGGAATPRELSMNIHKALRPHLGELKPLAGYAPYGMEGFAEFTRLYVTNPDVAKKLAPKFYDKFERDLEASYPEMKNALLQAREYYNDYLQGTPQSRIRAQTSYSEDKGKLANIIDSVKKGLDLDYLKTQFLDDVYPAKRLVSEAFGIPLSEVENLKDPDNLYRSLRVLKGAVGKADVFVLHETFDTNLDKVNGSLKAILDKLPDEESYREFNDYLIARRAIEKEAQNVETGIEFGDAVAVEKDLRPKYEKLAKELDRYNDTLLRYAKDAGLISQEQYDSIKKNNLMYVPFQREMGKKGGVASGGGKLQAAKPIKRMRGSTRDIIPPLESVLKNTYSIILNSEKNLSGQVLARLAKKKGVGAFVEAVPTPIALKAKVSRDEIERSVIKHLKDTGQGHLLEVDDEGKLVLRSDLEDIVPDLIMKFGPTSYPAGENIVTVYVEGKPRYYEVSPEIYEMWTKGISPYSAGLLTKILRIPARTLRAGAILNPRFIQKNFIRDTWGSWLFTKYGKDVKDPTGLFLDTLYSPLAMMATSAGKGQLYVEWMKAGGSMSTMQSLDRDHVVKKLDEVRNGIKPHQIIKWLRKAAEISEEANRLVEFGKALQVEGKTRLGKEIAAFASRDLSIDFAKMGLQAKALNQLIPFWNATVQGGDKLLRALTNPDDRKNFLPRVLGFIVIPSLIFAWLNKDDPNVKEFHEEEKDFNFITRIGDTYLKIPVPFETGVLAHGLTQRLFNYFMKEDPEAFEKFMGSIVEAMLPNFIPAFANPFIEAWANKNFFTGARIIPAGKEQLISRYQYKTNGSATARLLGRAMAYMLGDSETRSKAASPAILDHFVNSWTGGLGRFMISVSDESLEAAGLSDKIPGPNQAITEKLGLDAFTMRYPRSSTRSIEKFYDSYQQATALRLSSRHAAKMGEADESEVVYEKLESIFDWNTLNSAYKAIQNCQREINAIWNDTSIDADTKQEMIDDLYRQQIDFAKEANKEIAEHRLDQKD
jgi:hypothetical protein